MEALIAPRVEHLEQAVADGYITQMMNSVSASASDSWRIARGGQLYDKWWAVSFGAHAPTIDHPLWVQQDTNTRSGADTWRCKECHGWDYRGADGAYGSGSHYTGFAGVYDAAQRMTLAELEAVLRGATNPDHDFSTQGCPFCRPYHPSSTS